MTRRAEAPAEVTPATAASPHLDPAIRAGAPAAGSRGGRLGLSGLVLATFLLCVAWAVSLPPLSGPDEPAHMSSVVRLVDGGGWPLPYEAPLERAVRVAQYESGRPMGGQEPVQVPPEDRSPLSGGTVPEVAPGIDNMVQHPPTAYLVAAGAVHAVGGPEARWDRALLAMRVVSALLLAVAVGLTGVAVRAITRSAGAGLVGAAAVVAVPLVSMTGGYVSNDPALMAASAAAVAGIGVAARSPRPLRWLLLAGLAAGVALLVKGLALLLLPSLAMGGYLATRAMPVDRPRRIALALLPSAVALLVGGWWWVRNLVLLGTVQPSVLGAVAPREPEEPYDLPAFAAGLVHRLNVTFWSRGAREAMALPVGLVTAAGVALLVLLVAAFVLRGHRSWLLVLAAYPLAIIATTALNTHRIYAATGRTNGFQGRYLFAGLVVVALALAVVALHLGRRVPPRPRAFAAACAPVAGVLCGAGYLAWVVLEGGAPTGAPAGELLRQAAEGTGIPPWVAPLLVLLAVLASATGLVQASRTGGDVGGDRPAGPRHRAVGGAA